MPGILDGGGEVLQSGLGLGEVTSDLVRVPVPGLEPLGQRAPNLQAIDGKTYATVAAVKSFGRRKEVSFGMPNEKPAKPESESKLKAKAMLPENLWPVLDDFIRDYAFSADTLHGHPFTSPRVLAQLILMGWRCSADPIEQKGERS